MLNKFNLYWLTESGQKTITPKQFTDWKKTAIFDVIQGTTYGMSFCKAFSVMDGILLTSRDKKYVENYIKQTYVKG